MSSSSNKNVEICEVHYEGKIYVIDMYSFVLMKKLIINLYHSLALSFSKKYGDSFLDSFINDKLESVPEYQREEFEEEGEKQLIPIIMRFVKDIAIEIKDEIN